MVSQPQKDALKWVEDHVCRPGNDPLMAGFPVKHHRQRYEVGYAAYGPGPRNHANVHYLSDWKKAIDANENGISNAPSFILAGEHTSSFYVAFMEGALKSGRDAALTAIGQFGSH